MNKSNIYKLKYSIDREKCSNVYHFENGLNNAIEIEKYKGLGSTLFDSYIEKDFDDFSVEIAFSFWDYSVNESFLKSFVNGHYTHENGTHVDSILKGIIKASKKYVKEHHPDDRFVITKRTVLSFLLAGIHIKMKQPQFGGATKNYLESKEIIKPISKYIFEMLNEKFENDKESADAVIRHFYEIHWNKNWLKNFKY